MQREMPSVWQLCNGKIKENKVFESWQFLKKWKKLLDFIFFIGSEGELNSPNPFNVLLSCFGIMSDVHFGSAEAHALRFIDKKNFFSRIGRENEGFCRQRIGEAIGEATTRRFLGVMRK